MACRAVLRCSSHSYCPSLLYFSLPLFFQSFVSQDLVSGCHTFLSMFFLHSSCSISVSFSLSVPSCSLFVLPFFLTHPSALSPSHIFLCLIFSLLLHVSFALSLPLCRRGHCAGQTAPRSPPATALTCWEAGRGAQDLCTNQANPSLGSTVQSEVQREQPEVKCSGRTYNVGVMQGDIYVVGALI